MHNYMNKSLKILGILGVAVLVSQCGEDPVDPNEEELITTLTVSLVDANDASNTAELKFVDLDGEGGDAPTITGATLKASTTYNATISVLNESESPAENITTEIQKEDEEHQFFYVAGGGLNVTTSYSDKDSMDNPIGLKFEIVTGAASTGTLKVVLRHEPNKAATGVSAGDITNAGGETDIESTFEVTIQ